MVFNHRDSENTEKNVLEIYEQHLNINPLLSLLCASVFQVFG